MICYLVSALIVLGNPELPHFKITPAKAADLTFTGYDQCNVADAGAWIMRKIKIVSAKYGTHYALIDNEDYSMVNRFTWCLAPRAKTLYASTQIGGRKNLKKFYLHRLIMAFPPQKVDHKNRNGLDCRRINLRLATDSQNAINTNREAQNSSGFRGVYWRSNRKKWHAQIRINKKQTFIGYFTDLINAAKAYNEEAIRHHGEFAYLNKIPS